MKTPPTEVDTPLAGEELQRGLGQRQIEMIAIGGCIGTGLFLGSGKTISLAGPGVIVIYAVTGLMLYFVMRAMGELLLHDLRYKSFVDFSEDILGPWAGYVIGWSYWFAWIVTAIAETIAITGYIAFWWPSLHPWISAATTIGILLALNLWTVKAFGEMEFWLAIIKVVAIVVLIGLGLWLTFTGFVSPDGDRAAVSNLWAYGGFFPRGVDGLLAGLQITIFAFAGMEIIGTMMAEAKNPEKMLPSAIRKIPWRILLFYIGTVTVLMMATPWIHISPDKSPFVGMFALAGFASAAAIVNFVVTSSALSSCNSGVFATSRMLYGLARLHKAPAIFGKLSSHQVPVNAVILAAILMLGCGIALTTGESMMDAYQIVGSVAALLFIFVWSMILVAYLMYRRRLPQAHLSSAFKMPGGSFMPYVVFGFFGIVIYALTLNDDTRTALYVLPLWFVLLAAIFWLRTRHSPEYAQALTKFRQKVSDENRAAAKFRG